MFQWIKRIDYKHFKINARASWQDCRAENIITPVKKTGIGSRYKIESHIQFWCLHINHIIILHRLIYVNWLARKNVVLILTWELIIINLLWHQICKDCSNTFLSVLSFLMLHANSTNLMSILEHPILIVSGRVLKQCCLHENMELTENNNVYIIVICVVITVN